MKFTRTFLLIFGVCVNAAFCQPAVDSLIAGLQDKSVTKLNGQLEWLMGSDFFDRANPGKKNRAEFVSSIIAKTTDRARHLSSPAQTLIKSHMAEALVREGNVAEGFPFATDALQKSKSLDALIRSYVYLEYSDILGHLNFLDSSLIYAEKTLDLAHALRNDSLQKASLDRLAYLCYRSKNYPKAEFYYKELCAHPLTTDQNREDYYNTIGLTFRKRLMFDSSNFWYLRSMPIAVALRDTAWIGLLHGNIGYNYFLEKKFDLALPELQLDHRYSFHSGGYASGLYALSTIVDIYILQSRKDLSHRYYDSLKKSLYLNPDPELKLTFLKLSSRYYELNGDLTKALQFARAAMSFDDSLATIQNVARAADLQAQFDFTRQVTRIQSLEQQADAQFSINRQKNYLLIGTSLLIILGLGFSYVLHRSNQFKFRTNKLLQEQNIRISQQADHLNQLNDTKDKLFSIISHDLRGPINSLKSLLTMVHKKMITPEEFNQFVGLLQNNVEHVHFTLDNVLQWSRSQLQGIQTRPVATTLSALADESLNLFAEPIAVKGIKAQNDIHADVRVMADPDQIRLVFRNLISNAIKFSKNDGHIEITSKVSGAHEAITVTDSGIGMTPELIANLFNGNFATTTAGTDGEKGTGLGLLLCKEMVERNGGTIRAGQNETGGTRFIFTLPIAK